METVAINHDISLLYVTASSFPDGVMSAHQKLHSLIPFDNKRGYFGLSRPEQGDGIIYRAAAEQMSPDEANELGLETITIKAGKYLSITITDFMKDLPAVGKAFQELTDQPGIDMEGYCVERYPNKTDIQCMVRLQD